ncbi:MAG: GNAT family N-acetyltransferase [Gammaproteobacteria bacterium]|nr:GNAT family N-acetyltransferase [Gammaproteobacteria bacterium]
MVVDSLLISPASPRGWEQKCEECDDLFHSSAWQRVLSEGFRCSSVYLWNAQIKTGCALPVFPKGPVRIGYLGFPAGGGIGSLAAPASIVEALSGLSFGRHIDAIRVPISGFGPPALAQHRAVSVPETAIVDLPNWEAESLPSAIHRNLKKFERSELELRACDDADRDAECYHRLYLATIERHRGRRRYNRGYFRALLALSLTSDRLRCTGAYAGNKLAAFLVAASSGRTVFYLHGASHPRYTQARPSDALFQNAILWAKKIGAEQFNMMASPASQPGLVRFKEKWGGTTRQHRTCTIPVSWIWKLAAPLLGLRPRNAEQLFPR